MKKLIYIALALPAVLTSCFKDDTDIFGESAANRTAAAVEELDEALRSAPAGWVVDYYPESTQAYGGISMLMAFGRNDSASIATEIAPAPEASLYRVRAEEGVLLTFDTYNSALHNFSTPSTSGGNGYGYGYEGDYEFFLSSMTGNAIELVGKKTRNRIVMRRMAADADWTAYLDSVSTVDAAAYSLSNQYTLTVGETRYFKQASLSDSRRLTLPDGTNTATVFTSRGFRLYEPLTIDGTEVSEFVYNFDAAAPAFTAVGAAGIRLNPEPLNPNELLALGVSSWEVSLDEANSSAAFYTNFVAVAQAGSASMGETLLTIQLCNFYYDAQGQLNAGTSVRIRSNDGSTTWNAYNAIDITEVDGTTDRVTIAAGVSGLNASFYPVSQMATYLQNMSPWTVEANSPSAPTLLRLTSVADPDVWFIVSNQ